MSVQTKRQRNAVNGESSDFHSELSAILARQILSGINSIRDGEPERLEGSAILEGELRKFLHALDKLKRKCSIPIRGISTTVEFTESCGLLIMGRSFTMMSIAEDGENHSDDVLANYRISKSDEATFIVDIAYFDSHRSEKIRPTAAAT